MLKAALNAPLVSLRDTWLPGVHKVHFLHPRHVCYCRTQFQRLASQPLLSICSPCWVRYSSRQVLSSWPPSTRVSTILTMSPPTALGGVHSTATCGTACVPGSHHLHTHPKQRGKGR